VSLVKEFNILIHTHVRFVIKGCKSASSFSIYTFIDAETPCGEIINARLFSFFPSNFFPAACKINFGLWKFHFWGVRMKKGIHFKDENAVK